jgi:hypothetical protein
MASTEIMSQYTRLEIPDTIAYLHRLQSCYELFKERCVECKECEYRRHFAQPHTQPQDLGNNDSPAIENLATWVECHRSIYRIKIPVGLGSA